MPNITQRQMLLFIAKNKAENLLDTTARELIGGLHITERQCYYNIRELINVGLLENEAPNIYLLSLTDKGNAFLKNHLDLQKDTLSVTSFRFLDRGHKITIVAKLGSRPPKADAVPLGFTASKESKKLHWKFPALTKVDKNKGITVQITDTSISFGFRSIYGINPHEVVHTALNRCIDTANELERAGFKVLLPTCVIVQQHHALSNDDFAKYTAQFHINWLSDRLVFDKSVNPNEFELVNPNTAPEDFVRLVGTFEMLARGVITKEQLIELVGMLPKLRQMFSDEHKL